VGRRARCDATSPSRTTSVTPWQVATDVTGRLDFGVNSAGVSGGDDLQPTDYATETFDRMIAVDLRGTFLSMKHELRQMADQGFGSTETSAMDHVGLSVADLDAQRRFYGAAFDLVDQGGLDLSRAGVRTTLMRGPGGVGVELVQRAGSTPRAFADPEGNLVELVARDRPVG
jgi:Enoyl-(Acyl carrier protein) reductase